jgi:hypothetical protein
MKSDIGELGCEYVKWIQLTQEIVNMILGLESPGAQTIP